VNYRVVCLLVLIVLFMSEVYSQCTCEIVDPYPRYPPGREEWLGFQSKPVIICVYHYYGDYKIVIRYRTYYDVDYYDEKTIEYVNPIVYTEDCFYFIAEPYEYIRVDLVILSSDSEVGVLWDFCVLCCPSTTTITEIVESTITETHTETQFIHDSRAWIIILVFLIIVLLLKYFH
jgi:hypothetical protein